MTDKGKWYTARRKANPKSRGHFTMDEKHDKIFGEPKCYICGSPVLFLRKHLSCDSCKRDL